MSEKLFVLAGGGTGGHLYPGLAVAAALREADADARVMFMTTQRTFDRELLSRTDYEQQTQPVRPFTLNPLRWPAFWHAWRASVALAQRTFAQRRPAAVLGLGGYAAGPPVVAAARLGIRTAILNPDAIPGRANRFLARRAERVFLQWDVSRSLLPQRARCVTVGCPIRPMFAQTHAAAQARRSFGLDPARPVLLVTGASQGARSINRAMFSAWSAFAAARPGWQLLHLTGQADEVAARTAYSGDGVHVTAFLHEMWLALAAADLVVSRAGASTLAELTALGKPALLLPYPYHRDRHQHANARVLVDAGAALLLEDRVDAAQNRGPLIGALLEASTPQALAQMAQAARALGRPHAAQAVADWLRTGND